MLTRTVRLASTVQIDREPSSEADVDGALRSVCPSLSKTPDTGATRFSGALAVRGNPVAFDVTVQPGEAQLAVQFEVFTRESRFNRPRFAKAGLDQLVQAVQVGRFRLP